MDSEVKIIFSFKDIDNWVDMILITFMLAFIMSWCFYFRFMEAVNSRKLLINMEVLDNRDQTISRVKAKENLNYICKVTSNKKDTTYNRLFDQYWYNNREQEYLEEIVAEEEIAFFN